MKNISLKKCIQAAKDNPPFHLKESDKRYKKSIKFYKKNGFRFEETWNLDYTIASFILPRIAYLRDNHTSFNGNMTDKEWTCALDDIINGFYLYITKDDSKWTKEDFEMWNKTKELFCKYFEHLWD